LILVSFVVVNIVFIWVISKVDWNFSKAREAAQFKNEAFKVLVFGNSTALDGVNTEMLTSEVGESYNFAIGGATLEANFIQLENYLQSNGRPTQVLLFLSSCHLNYKKLGTVNPVLENEERIVLKLENIPLYKFRWLFIENMKKIISNQHRSITIVRGQLRITRCVPDPSTYAQSDRACLTSDDYLGLEFNYLWKMQALCKEQGIKFQVFEMPCWKRSQNECSDTLIENEKVDSLIVYNLNRKSLSDSLLNPNSDWLSENHLNLSGSVKITKAIVRILSK
jgi:hypothetical protein